VLGGEGGGGVLVGRFGFGCLLKLAVGKRASERRGREERRKKNTHIDLSTEHQQTRPSPTRYIEPVPKEGFEDMD
jgi:hypothetical protein